MVLLYLGASSWPCLDEYVRTKSNDSWFTKNAVGCKKIMKLRYIQCHSWTGNRSHSHGIVWKAREKGHFSDWLMLAIQQYEMLCFRTVSVSWFTFKRSSVSQTLDKLKIIILSCFIILLSLGIIIFFIIFYHSFLLSPTLFSLGLNLQHAFVQSSFPLCARWISLLFCFLKMALQRISLSTQCSVRLSTA